MIRYRIFLIVSFLLIAPLAQAAVYTVGADGACTHTSIAAAAAAAEAHFGADTIHVAAASDQSYTQQAISISTSQELDIIGGFADCSQTASSGSHVVIDGAGGAAEPVFRITVASGGLVRLSYLTIQHGDEDGSGKGGGIYFKGTGTLQLDHCEVSLNTAGYGGGIYAEGNGGFGDNGTQLAIGEDVAIVGNTARFDGGGVVNDMGNMTMTARDSYIANNHAPNGYGGGLLVWRPTIRNTTYLGSSGLGNLGLIYLNDASRGGGIAVMGGGDYSQVQLYSTDPARPARIKGNRASVDGGGIYLGKAFDAPSNAALKAWYAYIEDNIAPDGAAIAVRDSAVSSSGVSFNTQPLGSIDCPVGKPCGSIAGNAAIDNASQPVGGIVEASTGSVVRLRRMTIEGNTGKFVFFGNDRTDFDTYHVAITGNTVSGNLIAADSDSDYVDIENTTIAGNSIGTDIVLRLRSNAGLPSKLYRSIVWQPLKTTLHLNGDPLDLLDDMVSERYSIDGGTSPNVVVQDPRFVDLAHGDYSLRAGSPAVDYTSSVAGDDRDLYSNPRDVDLPIVANFGGRRDLGAIERQTLQPLVLNSDFDADLRLWGVASAGVTSWDGTRNASGAAGSGSAHITQPNAVTGSQVGGLVQCVHLPGPGLYALNGWGRGTGTMVTAGDIAELYWEYRKSGGENCTGGAPNATGTKTLSNGSSWSRPATPAYIVVTEQDWTYTSSIAVTLVAVENGASGAPTNAWFDGVTLGVDGDDTIFAGGFENP